VKEHWAARAELGTATGLSFLYFIRRRLGALPFKVALFPVVAWYFVLKSGPRLASRDFLNRALGRPATIPENFRHFLSFADAMLDKLVAWNNGFELTDVDFHGRMAVADALAQGQGLILVGSHLGNLEICRVLSRWRPGLELHVLVHTKHAENFNRILKRLDPSSQLNLHQVTDMNAGLAAWMSERIAAGAAIVIAGDRSPIGGGRSSKAKFFGAKAAFAQGPWILAHALACPVFLLFCVRQAGQGQRFRVDFEPFETLVHLPRGKERDKALGQLVQRYASRLEAHASQSPLQWFNFYPFWEAKN
jgi:predicted LPLAT superfamily acyltransferase